MKPQMTQIRRNIGKKDNLLNWLNPWLRTDL